MSAGICLMVYSIFAINKEKGQQFAVSVDLGKPGYIEWPCEVSIVGDNGEKGIRIGANIGRGWNDEAGGLGRYNFYIPVEGKYVIWVYSRWFDECSNASFIRIDDGEKRIIGNDPVYGNWHWVRGYEVELSKGTHELEVSNHSDHIAMQEIVF